MEGILSKYKVGDRVIHGRYGKGTVVCIKAPNYGVSFDKKSPEFHTLSNICEENRGWFCIESTIKVCEIKVVSNRLSRKMYPDAKEEYNYLIIEV